MSRHWASAAVSDAEWNFSGEGASTDTPSWLAPAYESSTFAISQNDAVESEPEADDPQPSAAIRALPSIAPPGLPQLEEVVVPVDPPYPDLREENTALRVQLADLTHAVAQVRSAVLAASEADLVRLACAIAERVARRELTLDPTLVLSWAKEASDQLAASSPLTLVISADLAALVDEPTFRKALSTMATLEVDPTLGPMRCEARAGSSRVDASLEERLAAVAEELGIARE
jgi:hypothetical protein